MKKKILFIFLAFTLLAFPFFTACEGEEEEQETKTFQIGEIVQYTGFLSTWDTLASKEAQLTADMINEGGWLREEPGITVDGQNYLIELVTEDSKCTLDGALSAFNKLVFDKDLKFIFGPHVWYAPVVADAILDNEIFHMMGYCTMTPRELDETTEYTFLMNPSGLDNFFAGLYYMKENYPDVETVVILYPDDGSIPYIGPIITGALEEAGYTVIGDIIGYDHTAVDFSPWATRAGTAGADAVVQVNGIAIATGSLIKGVREVGNDKPYIAAAGIDPYDVLEVCGEAAGTNVVNIGMFTDAPDSTDLLQELIRRMKTELDETTLNLQHANCIWQVCDLIQRAQSFDTSDVKAQFESMDTIEAFLGTGVICGLETYGIKHAVCFPVPVSTLEDGQVVFKLWQEVVIP